MHSSSDIYGEDPLWKKHSEWVTICSKAEKQWLGWLIAPVNRGKKGLHSVMMDNMIIYRKLTAEPIASTF